MRLIAKNLLGQGIVEVSDSFLARGGEGAVHLVQQCQGDFVPPADALVAKIYHEPSEGNRAKKIATMVSNAPDSNSLAWPLAILFNTQKQFVGYLMKKLDNKDFRQWLELANARDRRKTSSDFDVQYALTSCRNLAVAIQSMHDMNYYVGDINESNIFIKSDASILLVDTDSAQIVTKTGQIFPCEVGKPEYVAAELTHGSLRDQTRTVATDVFAFAVIVFQMITGGAHPMDGAYQGEDEPPNITDRIREGVLPNLEPHKNRKYQPISRIPSECIPQQLQNLLIQALSTNPAQRPTIDDFIQLFDEILDNLVQCTVVAEHWFDSRDGVCPWCQRVKNHQFDPWGPPLQNNPPIKKNNIQQTTLPSVGFQQGSNAPFKAPRAPAKNSLVKQSYNSPQSLQNAPQSNYSGGHGSTPMSNNSTPQNGSQGFQQGLQPQQPKHPEMIKGKVVLDYADGSWGIRPPMGKLIRQNPKIAWYCFKKETPSFAKAWWDIKRPVAITWGLLIGLIISLTISLSWYYTIPILFSYLEEYLPKTQYNNVFYHYFAIVSAVTAGLGGLSLCVSAYSDRVKTSKRFNGLKMVKTEKPWITILRFIPIPIIYGPILLIIIIVLIILGLINLLLNMIQNPHKYSS